MNRRDFLKGSAVFGVSAGVGVAPDMSEDDIETIEAIPDSRLEYVRVYIWGDGVETKRYLLRRDRLQTFMDTFAAQEQYTGIFIDDN